MAGEQGAGRSGSAAAGDTRMPEAGAVVEYPLSECHNRLQPKDEDTDRSFIEIEVNRRGSGDSGYGQRVAAA